MGQFFSDLGELVGSEGQDALLHNEMYLSRLMTYVEQVEDRKLRERRMRDLKRPRFDSGGFNKSGNSGKQPQGKRPNVPNQRFNKDKGPMVKTNPQCPKCGKNHRGEC